MSTPAPFRTSRARLLITVVLTLVVAVPLSVFAIDRFTDVPDSNTFHGSITWLADNKVTIGCNPPTNDEFCPKDNVTREQMATFMRRLAQTFGNTGAQVTEVSDTIPIDSASGVEVLSIEVTPKHEANVTLNAHVVVATGAEQNGSVQIRRDSCSGNLVGQTTWLVAEQAGFIWLDTFAVTGFDTIVQDTTYVLCVDKAAAADPPAAAAQRGLTATWSPTA
ncbi:MAG TPA: S-layer homology domain-containing protein [Acidimicrobiia bacterium]|nr:S-layer homology domain-containing protein [Acidimicrobiia bacterium]